MGRDHVDLTNDGNVPYLDDKVFQWYFDYFYGTNSGYGTVRTKSGNIFSTFELCKNNLDQNTVNYNVKESFILEYTIDSTNVPKKITCKKGP
jgi:hypothetical protein